MSERTFKILYQIFLYFPIVIIGLAILLFLINGSNASQAGDNAFFSLLGGSAAIIIFGGIAIAISLILALIFWIIFKILKKKVLAISQDQFISVRLISNNTRN